MLRLVFERPDESLQTKRWSTSRPFSSERTTSPLTRSSARRSSFQIPNFPNLPFSFLDDKQELVQRKRPLISPLFSASNTNLLVTLLVCVYDPSHVPHLHSRSQIFSLGRGCLDWARFRDSTPCSPLSVAPPFPSSSRVNLPPWLRGCAWVSGKWFWLSYVNSCFLFLSLRMYGLIGSTRNIAIRWELSLEALTEEPMTPCGLPFFHVTPHRRISWIPALQNSIKDNPPLLQGTEFQRGLLILHLASFQERKLHTKLVWTGIIPEQHIEKLLTSWTSKGLDVQTNEQISPPSVWAWVQQLPEVYELADLVRSLRWLTFYFRGRTYVRCREVLVT